MARKTLKAWIHECLTSTEYEGKCTRMVLSHMVGQGRTEIHTHKYSKTGSYEPDKLEVMFFGKADTYCQDIRGDSRFMLDAYWDSSAEPQALFPFVRHGQTKDVGSGAMSEPPTEEGRLAQRMKWEGDIVGQVFRRQERQDAREDRAAERMEKERETFYHQREMLMNQNMKFFELLKDLYMQTAVDTHKQTMEKAAFERGTKLREKVVDLLPIATNMLTGREVFPQSTIDTKIVEGIARRLTPEMIGMLEMVDMPDEEKGVLLHRINQAREKTMKEDAHRASLPQTTMDGETELTPPGEPH